MRQVSGLLLLVLMTTSPVVYAGDVLQEYEAQCTEAIGATVPDFNCDAGTLVPTTNHQAPSKYRPRTACDRPNQLNEECDPGSRFQVLELKPPNPDVYAVGHCRRQGLDEKQGEVGKPGHVQGKYGDIAVIMHNKKNGATCFYQALADWENDSTREKATKPLSGDVTAPSKGLAASPMFRWMTPASTAHISCGACHDNGPIVRSPYLTQIQPPDPAKPPDPDNPKNNTLPGAGELHFNFSDRLNPGPYYFVGKDFASWRAFRVDVKDNECNACHRMGINNVPTDDNNNSSDKREAFTHGTARDFSILATSKMLLHKNALDETQSPMWMTPDDPGGTEQSKHAAAAKAIKDCAERVKFKQLKTDADGVLVGRLPDDDNCRITPFAGRWKLAVARWQGASALFFKGHRFSTFMARPERDTLSEPSPIDIKDLGTGGIDAAVLWGNDRAYVFIGDQYARVNVKNNTVDKGFPRPIANHWPGVWAEGIDAAIPWNNGKLFFFKRDQYIQYDVKADKSDNGYPKPIADGWPEIAAKFPDGIDAGMQWDNEVAYFFKGTQYVKYNVTDGKVEAGYPKDIKGNWPSIEWTK